MTFQPVAPTISDITATSFKITINTDGNPGTTHYVFRVVVGAETLYADSSGTLQEDKIYLNITEITVTNAIPNSLHSISLSASDDAIGTNESSFGPNAGVITLAALPLSKSWLNIFSTTAMADWGANNNPIGTEYFVEVSPDINFLANVTQSGWTISVGHIFINLLPDTIYFGRVKARNSVLQETAYVPLPSFTTPTGPDTVKVIRVFNLLAERGFLITWQPNQETNITKYKVYRSSSPTDLSEFETIAEIPVPITSHLDRVPFTFGLVFYYKVTAIDDGGNESSLELVSPSHENTFHSFEEQPFVQNVKQDDFIVDEVPSGTIDNINVLYTTAKPYRKKSVVVHLNGIRLRPNIDYVEGPLSQQITMTDAPDTGGDLRVSYIKF